MNRSAFYVILIVLILGIFYVLKTADNPPDPGMTQTPKQYIERLERARAIKRAGDPEDSGNETTTEKE